MSDQTTIRPVHLAPIVAKPHGPSWDAVLRQDMADWKQEAEKLHAEIREAKAALESAFAKHQEEVRVLDSRIWDFARAVASQDHTRLVALESRWHERLHRWLQRIFSWL